MTYQETLNWMFQQLPMYQRVGDIAFKKDLTNSIAFCKRLGNPQHKFKTIHVGGTNGKGSTSHMLASILQEANYKVGLYTSPHLKNYTERIRINGVEIDKEFVTQFIEQHKLFLEKQGLSFFEMSVGLAFAYFEQQKVDVAIIEVGLGGRLDSTNIIQPQVSVITNIGFDHMQFLGDTLPKIASEKAGIIKYQTPVVIGERHPETQEVFIEKANKEKSPIYFASDNPVQFSSDLLGNYQKKNISTVFCALKTLTNFNINDTHITNGFLHVVKNTNLKGRWQILQDSPKTVCDTAHNTEGIIEVLQQISQETYGNLHMVLGVVNDKDLDKILPLFPTYAKYYFCKPNVSRGLCEQVLQTKAKTFSLIGNTYGSVKEAIEFANQNATQDDFIYIGGSTFVVAEAL